MKTHAWILFAGSLSILSIICQPASAVAVANADGAWAVNLNYQYVDPSIPFGPQPAAPSGVVVSCFGSGLSNTGGSRFPDMRNSTCADYESIQAEAGTGEGIVSKGLTTTGGFTITNTTDQILTGLFVFEIDAAGDFPLGINVIFAEVDNSTSEFASYSTRVTTPDLLVGDQHSCDTAGNTGESYWHYSSTLSYCGVSSTDWNPGQLYVSLGPDQTITETFTISLGAYAASPIPEAPTVASFFAGVLYLGYFSSRRAKARAS